MHKEKLVILQEFGFLPTTLMKHFKSLKSKGVDITSPEKQIWGGVLSTVFDQDKNSFGLVGDSKN